MIILLEEAFLLFSILFAYKECLGDKQITIQLCASDYGSKLGKNFPIFRCTS